MPPRRQRMRSASRQQPRGCGDILSFVVSFPWTSRVSGSVRRHRLFVEPGVLEAPAVVIAVDHHRVALEIGLPAGCGIWVEDRRSSGVLRELALDLPNDLLALGRVGLARL